MDWKAVGKGMVIADLVVMNLGLGWIIYRGYSANTSPPTPLLNSGEGSQAGEWKYMDERLVELKRDILAEVAVAGELGTPVPTNTQAPRAEKVKVRQVQYVTIPGSGRSAKFDWESLAGTEFYFDTKDYPGLVEVYFDASMNLFNGNGKAFVRLFDATHGVGVQGSEVESPNQATTVVQSGKLNFWAGKNLIKVQAKTLTSDTAVFSYGRLRVVTEN